jgi:methyl-accepting chemotaxis protein
MTLFNRLELKTKLVGSFIFIVFLSGVVAFIGIRLSIGQISQTVIPFLKNMGQVGELAKTVQAETIEYVIQGEAETREDLAESLDLLQSLATQVENTPTTDPAERATLDHLALVVNQTADLSDQIVQSHDDTLEQLEALEALEGETDLVFQEVVSLMEAQITTSLRTGIPDEGAMLAQQALSEFNSQAGRLHIEALEFAATGEDEAIEQFETAADRLAQAQRDLETIWQAAGADEAVLLNRLQRLKDEFERLGHGIFASHQQTLDLLAELERIEEEPAGVIAATQLVADNQANRQLTEANRNMLLFSTGVLALATLLGLSLAKTITSPVDDLVAVARQVGDGQTDQRVRVTTRDEIGELAVVFNQMIDNLRQRISAEQTAREEAHQARVETEAANRLLEEQIWQITGQANLNERMRGEQNMVQLANSIILHLCRYLPAQLGALYLADESQLNLMGTFAHNGHQPVSRFGFGEGLVGQVAQEKTPLLIDKIPADYLTVRSGFGESPPRNLGLYPFMFEEQVIGVIELGSLTAFSPAQQSFLQTTMEAIGVTFHMAMTRARIQELLTVLQNQSDQLQDQEEELLAANEELEALTESLRIY